MPKSLVHKGVKKDGNCRVCLVTISLYYKLFYCFLFIYKLFYCLSIIEFSYLVRVGW